jgi:hypothetical protein
MSAALLLSGTGFLLRQQRERLDVSRADDREMPQVQRGDFVDVEAFSESDHGRVARAEGEVCVLHDQVCHPVVVGTDQVCGDERAVRDRTEETGFDLGTAVAGEEVADLGDDGEGTSNARFARWRPVNSSVQR